MKIPPFDIKIFINRINYDLKYNLGKQVMRQLYLLI
jgi:hypothetical protein